MQSYFIILFSLLTISLVGQSDCYETLSFYPVNVYPTDQDLFQEDTYLEFTDTTVVISDDTYSIKDIIPNEFFSKKELVQLIGCIDDFSQFTDVVNGEYYQYILDADYEPGHDRLILLKLNDCDTEYTFILTMRGMYRLQFLRNYISDDVEVIKRIPEKTLFNYLLLDPDTNQTIQVITEAEYEIVTEQVLVHDGYNGYEITPAEYDTIFFTAISETSSCPEAEIVEQDFVYNYLPTDVAELSSTDPEFEVVTEEVLVQYAHSGSSYYKRELKDSSLTVVEPYQEILITGVTEGCNGSVFTDCLETQIIEYPAKDTLVRNVIDYCQRGYDRLGLYCYSLDESPNTFEIRRYPKLSVPAIIKTKVIEAYDKTIQLTKIQNKQSLDPGCIDTIVHHLFSLELTKEASAEATFVAPEYGIRSYKRVITPAEIIVDTTLIDEATSTQFYLHYPSTEVFDNLEISYLDYERCTEREIVSELIALDYLVENQPLDRLAFYLAIAQFQKDNGLRVGIIDWPFIELLLH